MVDRLPRRYAGHHSVDRSAGNAQPVFLGGRAGRDATARGQLQILADFRMPWRADPSTRLALYLGALAALTWAIGVGWVVFRPGTVIPATNLYSLPMTERLNLYLNPNFVDIFRAGDQRVGCADYRCDHGAGRLSFPTSVGRLCQGRARACQSRPAFFAQCRRPARHE